MIDRDNILTMIMDNPDLKLMNKAGYKADEVIIEEGQLNSFLYILLQGEVELKKKCTDNKPVHIDHLRGGDLVGLISFVSEGPALTSAIAQSEVSLLQINRLEFEELVKGTTPLSSLFHHLIVDNLVKRYQTTVGLQLKFENQSRQLNQERDQLRTALDHLEAIQQQLISQEKMALLGELSAGISHEMNNPAAALSRSIEHLDENLSQLIEQVKVFSSEQLFELLRLGKNDKPVGTVKMRTVARQLEQKHPEIVRSIIRKLAGYPDETRFYLINSIPRKHLSKAMEVYETGQLLSIMGESTRRITSMVQSLRSFIRPATGYEAKLDVRDGLLSTIQLFQHKLKNHELDLDLQEVPPVSGNSGELNQVWTNILDNACDALHNQKGKIAVCTSQEDDLVHIDISNTGPNIPDEVKHRIFDANYTTKNTNGTFGLGIGLTITKDIISKHKGKIHVLDAKGGGAWFRVTLPVASTVHKP